MTALFQLLSKEPSSEPGSPETYGDFDYQVNPAALSFSFCILFLFLAQQICYILLLCFHAFIHENSLLLRLV